MASIIRMERTDMNITITGNLGSGKTSVCKELKQSGFTIISAGDIFREIAAEKGMTVIELNEAAKSDRSIDDLLDNRSTELGKKMDHAVFDSRLAWHFVENSFKVFLLVDTQEAARRVYEGDNRSAETYQNMDEARVGLEARAKLEQARFQELYSLDYYDAANYDLIIESSCATPKQIAQEIIRNFELYQKQPFSTKTELNLKCLYPTKRFDHIDIHKLREWESLCQDSVSESLCIGDPLEIVVKDGYNYLLNGHHAVFSALAAGKIFAQIIGLRMEETDQALEVPLPQSDMDAYEQAGKFHYQVNPLQMPKKAWYTVDFSKVLS